MATQTVDVKSGYPKEKDGGFKIAIFERDERHKAQNEGEEDGELFIADDKVHTVAMTPGVKAALSEGRLVEADADGNAVDTDDDNTEGFTLEELNRLNRAEHDALAAESGIADADKMANKGEVAQAIFDAHKS